MLPKLYKSKLWNFLRLRSVYINTKRTIPQGLVDILKDKVCITWLEQELLKSINIYGIDFNLYLNFYYKDSIYVLKKKLKEQETVLSLAL